MHEYALSLIGGLIMGVASAGLFAFNGRILGISGVLGGAFKVKSPDVQWRWAFIAGMLTAGAVTFLLYAPAFDNEISRSFGAYVLGGVLVGLGTQLGSGCTSGHGICGIGRGSKRSLTATCIFMATAAFSVFVVQHLFGGSV